MHVDTDNSKRMVEWMIRKKTGTNVEGFLHKLESSPTSHGNIIPANHSVAIVAIARMENPYVNEWIQYHIGLGFDHVYIYDNSYGNEVHINKAITGENIYYSSIWERFILEGSIQ